MPLKFGGAYAAAIEEDKTRVPTAQEEEWNKVQRGFDMPATTPAAAPAPTVEPVPEPTQAVPKSPSMPLAATPKASSHTPSWRDHLAPIIHSMSWTDRNTGVSHSVNLRADTWAELMPDITAISEVAKRHTKKPAAPEAAAETTPPAAAEKPVPTPTPVPESRPAAATMTADDPEWCEIHQCAMRKRTGNGGSDAWYSHQTTEPEFPSGWCKGRRPKRTRV